MIKDPELLAAFSRAHKAWRISQNQRTRPDLFFCHDCNRRFFNKGWHAEACGSSNYSIVIQEDK
jgi:hypothetical protein